MLKHVHNTLSRRHSSSSTSQSPARCPPSPAPSSISSCSSLSSGSMFFTSTPTTSSYNHHDGPECNNKNSSSNNNNNDGPSGYSPMSLSCSSFSPPPPFQSCLNVSSALDESSGSSSSTSSTSSSSSSSSSASWTRRRSLALESRVGSRLSINSNISDQQIPANSIPLRVYAGCLRPDIQYKTVGVNHSTNCEQVINSILAKCKLRYKDPKLFSLTMDLKMRAPNGADVEASIPLEETAYPLRLQECYPRGQAKFSLKMNTDECRLVKVYDETGMLGWQYKSIMISEKTTAKELIDILFRFTTTNPSSSSKNSMDTQRFITYTLHLEVNQNWSQRLDYNDLVIPMQSIVTNQFGANASIKLVLQSHYQSSSSSTHGVDTNSIRRPHRLLSFQEEQHQQQPNRNSTISLYENVNNNTTLTSSPAMPSPSSSTSTTCSTDEDSCKYTNYYWRRRRSHSLSSSGGSSSFQSTSIDEGSLRRKTATDYEKMLIKGFDIFGLNNNENNNSRLLQNQKVEFFV